VQKIKRIIYAIVLSVSALATGAAVPAHAVSPFGAQTGPQTEVATKAGWCASFNAPVAPAPGQQRTWQVALTYCQPFRWAKGTHQVDVLTHGSTYTHTYWDWPQYPALYSYVDKTLAAGRATLNYDRIGAYAHTGTLASTRPASTDITMATDAYVLHQLVQGLRLIGYQHINSVSHSYGAGVALAEAAAYAGDNKDVSKVVLTGYLHRPSNPAVTAGNYPANQDPKFAGAGLDDGYLTTRPNTRGASFHSSTSDPTVIAFDELQKDIVSRTGLLDFLGQRAVPAASNISNTVHIPVLVVEGQKDAIFCYDPATFNCADNSVVTANEAPYYAGAPKLKVVTIPASGHDLALHPSAYSPEDQSSFAVISQWLQDN